MNIDPGKAARAALITARKVAKAEGGLISPDAQGIDSNFEDLGDDKYERRLNPLGLYSKAAEIAHTLPQKSGSKEQFLAALKNKGVKPAEIEHAGVPELPSKTTNTAIGKHFDRNAPQLSVAKLGHGSGNPGNPLNENEKDRMYSLYRGVNAGTATPEENDEYRSLARRNANSGRDTSHVPTKYHGYKTNGGTKYREHLITTPSKINSSNSYDEGDYLTNHPDDYHSSHWDHPNVVAHVRMQDMNKEVSDDEFNRLVSKHQGRESPEFVSDYKKAKPKILHVDEIQSDWGQQGRENGFKGDGKEEEKRNKITEIQNRQVEIANNHNQDWDRINDDPEYRRLEDQLQEHFDNFGNGVPKGPFVQNTQHWTDLALKHVLHEAAKGDYDKVQFATGKENTDRYGLAQHFKSVHYNPQTETLATVDQSGNPGYHENIEKGELHGYIGEELAKRILSSPLERKQIAKAGPDFYGHHLEGDDLVHGGEGMRQFYDQMIPKSAMKLVQQHDPDIKPEKITGKDGVERFGFSLSDKAKASIKRGQPMFARGGAVLSEAQKEAGNYKKDHLSIQGLNIAIENAKGSVRSGTDKSGKKWSVKMPADYGYIKGTSGADGDHVDVYIGPNRDSDSVFVVDQKDHVSGKFDEHKVMLGFKSLQEAISAYDSGFSDGKGSDRRSNISRLTMHEFKQWLKNHNTTKPIVKQHMIDKALSVAKSAQGATR